MSADQSLLPYRYYAFYLKRQKFTLFKHFDRLKPKNGQSFWFYNAQSAVYSSQIEGNPIDVDTFLKYREYEYGLQTKPFQEIQDLIVAYEYAQSHVLTFDHMLQAHKLSSDHLPIDDIYKGHLRDRGVSIYNKHTGQRVYEGPPQDVAATDMYRLFDEIAALLSAELSIDKVFYYGSMIHLRYVHIHGFADGNGRMARLMEKWFLASKLGRKAWYIQSERYYRERQVSYYKNVNQGQSYSTLDYDHCLDFLLMLPFALKFKFN